MAKIALAEMVEQLRSELREAVAAGEGRDLRFDVEEITIEAQVEVTKEVTTTGKVKFWVFTEAAAEGKLGSANLQKVIVRMRPQDAKGGKVLLSRGRGSRGSKTS
ncbi:MAG: trypco2 family protein [Thermoanaerobaculia bacterium]|nr:trypco2 family protein [Thermoanaerobaculia bacterium]